MVFYVNFALSKSPYFHSAYVVGVYIFFSTAVFLVIGRISKSFNLENKIILLKCDTLSVEKKCI